MAPTDQKPMHASRLLILRAEAVLLLVLGATVHGSMQAAAARAASAGVGGFRAALHVEQSPHGGDAGHQSLADRVAELRARCAQRMACVWYLRQLTQPYYVSNNREATVGVRELWGLTKSMSMLRLPGASTVFCLTNLIVCVSP
jgi:hypothetical protein